MTEQAWTLDSSTVSCQGSQESVKVVTSDTENLEEEEELTEEKVEAGSQTDIPAAAEVCMAPVFVLAIQISCGWKL